MKQFFIPYELAVIAKEKGFNEECLYYYLTKEFAEPVGINGRVSLTAKNENTFNKMICAAPLYQQILDWLDKQGIFVSIEYAAPDTNKFGIRIDCYTNGRNITEHHSRIHKTRIEALNKAIKEAFKLI